MTLCEEALPVITNLPLTTTGKPRLPISELKVTLTGVAVPHTGWKGTRDVPDSILLRNPKKARDKVATVSGR